MPDQPRHARSVRFTVLALAAIYAIYFSLYTCIVHGRYGTYAYDLGTFDQGIWLAGHGTDLFVTVRGLHLLGDHVRLFSFVLAPLYWIWDDVRALLVLQSVVIAVGAWFVCRIAQRELPDRPWLALALSAGWLLHPAVQNLNLDHAHPDAFASTFLLASVDFLRGGRLLPFCLAAALAMSCKEDVPLAFVGLGIVLAVRPALPTKGLVNPARGFLDRARRLMDPAGRRFGCMLAAAAGAYFLLALGVVLPMFNGVGFFRLEGGGFLAGLGAHGSDPSWFFSRLLRWESAVYLFSVGASQLFLFLIAPLWLLPALPSLAANLLSDASYMRSLDYHYHAMVVPFVFVATIDALARIGRPAHAVSPGASTHASRGRMADRVAGLARRGAAPALLAAAVACNVAWSKVPVHRAGVIVELRESLNTNPTFAGLREMLARIPDDAVVSADYTLVPHLSHRRGIYLYPNPFSVSNWGILGENTHDPETIDYIAVRDRLGSPALTDEVATVVGAYRFEKIAGGDGFALYRSMARAPVGPNASCGDWDGDGATSSADVDRITYAIMRGRDCPPAVCDADGDGTVRYADVLRVNKRLANPAAPLDCPR